MISKRTKTFLSALLLSLPVFWGVNVLEKSLNDFFYWYEVGNNPRLFAAQIALEENLMEMKPIRNKAVPDFETEAKSIISVLIDKNEILFEKLPDEKLAIASLTKLMTALVVLENYDLSKEITISKESANQNGNIPKLQEGKTFSVEYLLYPLLMESSNIAAFALANDYNGTAEREFVTLMNNKAKEMGMNDTFFDNSSGLDPEESGTEINYSTANDMVKLVKRLLEKPLVWQILSTPQYSLYGPELINTNRFLIDDSNIWQDRIIGGKTGYTEKAGGCFLLAMESPRNRGTLINVILGVGGTESRFYEMKRLVSWLNQAYKW
ncbi:MAG: D-alanyl-D-alanine carboxypeptidase [Candidatus Nealsonbacteria bacterium]|nr:D-alanyl-D-alanine carboxypeptidase [Candidatus Nealsonbacteria bacterium]